MEETEELLRMQQSAEDEGAGDVEEEDGRWRAGALVGDLDDDPHQD